MVMDDRWNGDGLCSDVPELEGALCASDENLVEIGCGVEDGRRGEVGVELHGADEFWLGVSERRIRSASWRTLGVGVPDKHALAVSGQGDELGAEEDDGAEVGVEGVAEPCGVLSAQIAEAAGPDGGPDGVAVEGEGGERCGLVGAWGR